MPPTALITGASTGIGYELSKCFARAKCNVILVARSEQRLREVAEELEAKHPINTRVIVADLSDPAAPQALYDQVKSEEAEIECLVNNAGFGLAGKFAGSDLQEQLGMMQLNMTSLVALTRLFLNDMVERNAGRILNVASTAAFQPVPTMAVYGATKAFVLSFSEALAHELRKTPITVTALCPGATITEFQVRAGLEESMIFKNPATTVEYVAETAFDACMRGQRVVVPGFMNKFGVTATRFFPRKLVAAVSGKIMES